jgi:Protein of unknown function (DUF732)
VIRVPKEHSETDGELSMKALAAAHRWIWLFRYQPLTIRLLAGVAGVMTAAAAFAAPAEASPSDDNFLGALTNAGVHFGEPGGAVAMGQSVCPMLAKPGGDFAGAVQRVRGGGISPEMAGMFATIAIQMYCPSMMANIASGNLNGLPHIPGMPGMPGMPGI